MPTDDELLLCYNKGCGKSFDPKQNEPGRFYLNLIYLFVN